MDLVSHIVTIPKYSKVDGKFVIDSEVGYTVTYLKSNSIAKLEVVVNNIPTGVSVNIENTTTPFKSKVLLGIAKFQNQKLAHVPATKKSLTLKALYEGYSNGVVRIMKTHLLTINKITKRDTLTKFNLI